MSRDRQHKLQIKYNAETDRLKIWYSKRGTENAIGLRIVPDIILGISSNGRVISWQIENPRLVLTHYLADKSSFDLKPDFYLKSQLDQQQIHNIVDFPNDTQAFVSRWVLGFSSQPYVRR
jgi:hypothetical protein